MEADAVYTCHVVVDGLAIVVVYFRHGGKGVVILDTILSGLLVLYHVGLFQ